MIKVLTKMNDERDKRGKGSMNPDKTPKVLRLQTRQETLKQTVVVLTQTTDWRYWLYYRVTYCMQCARVQRKHLFPTEAAS